MREAEQENRIKAVSWISSSQKDLKEFPTEVQRTIGYALYVAQVGEKHSKAKPLRACLKSTVVGCALRTSL